MVYKKATIYGATKHAVHPLNKALRVNLLKHSIKVTVINPGLQRPIFLRCVFWKTLNVPSQSMKVINSSALPM
ncbi:MAG: SDR family NAD(P)-dependent oxidoreductase [Flavobacteriales bacterium]